MNRTATAKIAAASPASNDGRLVELANSVAQLRAQLALLTDEASTIDAEYAARGTWTRAYLVTGGHLHTSTACSTCFSSTQFYWVTELSGKTEAEIVEAAGERACTICFPSAPVDVLRRKSVLFTPEERDAAAAREAKADKAAKAAAESITVDDLYAASWGGHKGSKTFKTQRAVSNLLASTVKSIHAWGLDHPTAPQWEHDAVLLAITLSNLTGERDGDILTAAHAKAEKAVAADRRKVAKLFPNLG